MSERFTFGVSIGLTRAGAHIEDEGVERITRVHVQVAEVGVALAANAVLQVMSAMVMKSRNMAVALPPGTGISSVWVPRKPADLVLAARCYGPRNAPH